jgi:hypothetical protein
MHQIGFPITRLTLAVKSYRKDTSASVRRRLCVRHLVVYTKAVEITSLSIQENLA